MVLQSGDVLFRVVFFWASFLPLGARCSLDSLRQGSPRLGCNLILSPATLALLLQVCFLYWFAAALKSDPVWRQEGSAIYYALSIDQIVTRAGRFLLGFPHLLTFLTFATLAMEALGPVLLFCPVWTGPVRLAVVTSFLLFHLVGLNLCMDLGLFPYICAVAWGALLPGWFWDRLVSRLRVPVRLKRVLDRGASLAHRVAARVGRHGAEDSRADVPSSSLVNAAVLFLLLYVFCWNLRTLNFARYSNYFPPQANCLGCTLGLDQMWSMYAPHPLKEDGWWVVQGHLRDGSRVDVCKGGRPVRWEKPDLVSETYKNERWRKYMLNLWHQSNAGYRPYFARYLFREWNARHGGPEQLESLEVYYLLKVTLPDYRVSEPEKVLVCNYPALRVVTASR